MTRVIHTGDTHLGYRQYHSPERREDFLDAFRRVAADAIEMDVDAVVHAGDLFHDRRPGLSDLLGTMDVLETLSDADVPFLAIVGNHETKRDAQWLDLFEAMGVATRLGDAPVVVEGTAFYGLDFVPRSRRDDLEYKFTEHDADHAALVSHGLFQPLVPDYGNVEWDAREVLAEANVDFDAMLLGDEHAPTRRELEGAWVTYCGSTERTSAAERDERGYNVVEFDGNVHITRRGLETREFVFVDLELAETEGFDRVRDRLAEHDLEDAVVHVTLSGEGEDLSAARVESYATDRGALVARVNDRREVDEETDLEVAFVDPDEAVRERVRELGLSDAARELDETIRASKVSDSNVKDEVERRVRKLLDDPSAFETERETDETAGSGGYADDPERHGEADDDREASTDGTGRPAGESDATAPEAEQTISDTRSAAADETSCRREATETEATTDGDDATDGSEHDSEGTDEAEAGTDGTAGGASGPDGTDGTETGAAEPTPSGGDGDGQASMEDYL